MDSRYATDDMFCVQYPLPPEIGQGGFTSLKLESGVSLHHSHLQFMPGTPAQQPLSAMVEIDLNEPTLLVHTVLVGGVTRHDRLSATTQRIEPGRSLIRWAKKTHSELVFDRLPAVEIVYLHASQSSLHGLLGSELTTRLIQIANGETRVHSLPRVVTAPMRYCFDYQLQGSLHKLHAQNKALEFIEGLIRHFDKAARRGPVAPEYRAVAINEFIKKRGSNLPTTAQLAREFDISIKTMNLAFLQAYGMSVPEFIRERRLAAAHEQLTSSTLSVSEVAASFGYSQVSNFSTAFKAFYGYSPSALRKSIEIQMLGRWAP
jgi:AraC-like DNA-binding protein